MDYESAIAGYESLLGNNPTDPNLLWRIARAYVCLGEPFEDGRRLTYCLRAEEYAKRCIVSSPGTPEGHTWLAGALGYVALHEESGRQVELTKAILVETNKAIEINPRDDAAWSIKGSLYRALGNIGWVKRQMAGLLLGGLPDGGFQEAESCLLRAVAIAPDVMRHHYELGILYLDMNRREEAKQAFEKAAALPIRVAIDVPRLQKAKTYLKTLQ
jgi:tetratricopeptide (TPR) repeat protein